MFFSNSQSQEHRPLNAAITQYFRQIAGQRQNYF